MKKGARERGENPKERAAGMRHVADAAEGIPAEALQGASNVSIIDLQKSHHG